MFPRRLEGVMFFRWDDGWLGASQAKRFEGAGFFLEQHGVYAPLTRKYHALLANVERKYAIVEPSCVGFFRKSRPRLAELVRAVH